MNQPQPSQLEHSQPDVVDAIHAIRGLLRLTLRRAAAMHGQVAADALLRDVESGARQFVFSVELKQVEARIAGAASKDGEIEPLLNMEIGMLQAFGVAPDDSRVH